MLANRPSPPRPRAAIVDAVHRILRAPNAASLSNAIIAKQTGTTPEQVKYIRKRFTSTTDPSPSVPSVVERRGIDGKTYTCTTGRPPVPPLTQIEQWNATLLLIAKAASAPNAGGLIELFTHIVHDHIQDALTTLKQKKGARS